MNTLTQAIEQEDDTEETGETAVITGSAAKLSIRGAVNNHCRDCIYDPFNKGAGNWRQQVEACMVVKCSLYPVRPISKPRKASGLMPEAPGVPQEQLPSAEE